MEEGDRSAEAMVMEVEDIFQAVTAAVVVVDMEASIKVTDTEVMRGRDATRLWSNEKEFSDRGKNVALKRGML